MCVDMNILYCLHNMRNFITSQRDAMCIVAQLFRNNGHCVKNGMQVAERPANILKNKKFYFNGSPVPNISLMAQKVIR
jgi:hypothetical protein